MLPNVPAFVERNEEIKRIHEEITNMPQQKLGYVIAGLGGVGKTEMARYYCHLYSKDSYNNNIIWLNAENQDVLELSFRSLAETLNLQTKDAHGSTIDFKAVVHKVYNHFSGCRSLFVFDNAPGYEQIKDAIIVSSSDTSIRPKFLITSQFTQWGTRFARYKLDIFSTEQAKSFLQKNLQECNHLNDENAVKLSTLVQFLPLALQQCVSYIFNDDMMVDDYIKLYISYSQELLSVSSNDVEYTKTVLTTWNMALVKIREKYNELAIVLMHLFTFLDGTNIAKELLLPFSEGNVMLLNESIKILTEYSLINHYKIDDIITIHSLVQEVISWKHCIANVMDVCLAKFLDSITPINLTTTMHVDHGRMWMHHLTYMVYKFVNKPALMQILLERIGVLITPYCNRGKSDELIILIKKIRQTLRIHNYQNDWQEFYQHMILGQIYFTKGSSKEALVEFQPALELSIRLFGSTSPFTFSIRDSIAHNLMGNGDLQKAWNLIQETSTILNKFRKEGDVEGLTNNYCKGLCLYHMGKQLNGLCVLRETIDQFRAKLGANHFVTINNSHGLAKRLICAGFLNDAYELIRSIKDSSLKLYGIKHTLVLTLEEDLAILFVQKRNFLEAKKYYVLIEQMGDHLDKVTKLRIQQSMEAFAILDFAVNLKNAGYFDMALIYYNESLKKLQLINLYSTNCIVLQVQRELGELLEKKGDVVDALNKYRSIEQEHREYFGCDHPFVQFLWYRIVMLTSSK